MSIVKHIIDALLPAGGPEGPSLDTMLAQFDKELENFDTLRRQQHAMHRPRFAPRLLPLAS